MRVGGDPAPRSARELGVGDDVAEETVGFVVRARSEVHSACHDVQGACQEAQTPHAVDRERTVAPFQLPEELTGDYREIL